MGALDMTYQDVMNGDVPKTPARNPMLIKQAALPTTQPAAPLPAPAGVPNVKPTQAAPSIPPAAPNPTLLPVPPGIAKNTAANPNPMAPPATLADIRTPNSQAQPRVQAVQPAPAQPAADQTPTDPDRLMINGIPHLNVTPQTRNPFAMAADAVAGTAAFIADGATPTPFQNRAEAIQAKNRAELNTELTQSPSTAMTPQAGTPNATGNPVEPSASSNPLDLQGRQAGYMIDNNLRQFEDKGNGAVRQVGANGKTEFTNVGVADVTDPGKAVQVNSYNGAADNVAMAKANAIRQQMIDRMPQGGVAVMADPNETANAEKTARWRQDDLIAKSRHLPAAGQVAVESAHGQNQMAAESMRGNVQFASEAGRNAVATRGQDLNAASDAARIAGNPLDNELKKQQITSATTANTRAQKQADALDLINAETDPAKRQAKIEALMVSQGKNPAEHRYVKVDGGEEMGPDGLTKIKRPSGVYDTVTQRFIPMTVQGQTGGTQAALVKPQQLHIDALKKDPSKAAEFDAKFGAGASKQYLGG